MLYRTSTQSLDKSRYLKVGLEDARELIMVFQAITTTLTISVEFIYNFTFHCTFVYTMTDLP